MRTIKLRGLQKIFTLSSGLVLSVFVFAMDWPLREGTLVTNFGSNDNGSPVLGDTFSTSSSVYPTDVGELIFSRDPDNSASRLPSPLGSWLALDHGDNLVGIYSRYEDRAGMPVPTIVAKDNAIAVAGQSGWTDTDGFFFAFFDRKERRWINPSMLIDPISDDKQPVIRQIELRNQSGNSFNPSQVRSIPQGTYSVYVDTVDGNLLGESLAPNRIICSLNGVELGVVSFETFAAKNGSLMVYRNVLVPASRLYQKNRPGFDVGEIRLTRGQATLVIEVRDIAENSRSISFRLNVE